MSIPERLPCSDSARERGDRWVGTAPPARRWFLVTQPGDWGTTAWEGLAVGPSTRSRLRAVLDRAGARLMLVRRPGRHSEEPHAWAIVDRSVDPPVRWGPHRDDEDLLRAAETLLDPQADVDLLPEPLSIDLLMVCSHGRHDRCCAVRGRPVAAALAEQWPEDTWECTHTGGDRFAANLVLLPDGACYGGLDPAEAVGLVRAHRSGHVDPTHLRGPTGHRAQVQAAVVAAHDRWGPLAWDDVTVDRSTGGPEEWTVELHVSGIGPVRVRGHTEHTAPHLLTCRATGPDTMALAVVDEMAEADPGPSA